MTLSRYGKRIFISYQVEPAVLVPLAHGCKQVYLVVPNLLPFNKEISFFIKDF